MTVTAAPQQRTTADLPPVDDRRVGVGILFPADGSYLNAQVQQPITISGSVDVDPLSSLTKATITLSVDGTSLPSFTVNATDGVWSKTAPILANGPHTIDVTAQAIGKTATASVRFTIDTIAPVLTINSPKDNDNAGVSEADNTVDVTATATDNIGVASVIGRVGAGGWAHLTPDRADRTTWRGRIPVPAGLPLGTRTTLDVSCADNADNTASRTINITTADNTPPAYEITSGPPDGARILNRPSVGFAGTARDRQSGVRAGDGVVWSLDDGVTWTPAATSDNWANWTAEIPTPTAKSYTVRFRFTDAAGNAIGDTRRFEMVGAYYQTLEERLSPRAYLDGLVQFIHDHAQPTLEHADFVARLEQLFCQPFGKLIDSASDLGQQPVRQLRIGVEVLRKYLAATLLGHWTFDQGGGTAARDSSSYGSDATLVGNPAWTSGRFGGALSFDGSSYAVATNAAALEVGKNGADFSVAFWLKLNKPAGAHNVRLLHKGSDETQRTFALFAVNNVIHFCISTTAAQNEYDYGRTPIVPGEWTHIAYVKAGAELRLYVNGVLDKARPLQGTSVSNNGPLHFGNVEWQQDPTVFAGLDGALDDVRLYNVALSLDTVRFLASDAAGTAAAMEDHYRSAAYEAMLAQIGTSYDEIRFIRAADRNTEAGRTARKALADRIGILLSPTASDELDQLFRTPSDVTETWLATMFGLPDTARDASDGRSTPKLLDWQRARLQQQWRDEDYPLSSTAEVKPIIDPDVIDVDDFAHPTADDAAFSLWRARRDSVADEYNGLAGMLAGKTAQDGFDAIVNEILKPTPNDPQTGVAFLQALESDYKGGKDVAAALRTRHLTVPAFLALLRVRALAGGPAGSLTDAEWNDACNILVQAWKERNCYADWRDAESARAITLSPTYFKVSPSERRLTAWRASKITRHAWQDRLQTRIDQNQELQDAFNAAVDAVQQLTLPLLRDALVAQARERSTAATDQPPALENVADDLSGRLQIDLRTSGAVQTTRTEQAIETLQGLVFARRSGLLDPAHPAAGWDLLAGETGDDSQKEPNFVEEWTWLGSYANWRAAMSAFLHPENLLLPSLRPDRTGAFDRLVGALQAPGRLTPGAARAAAADYMADLDADMSADISADLGRDRLVGHWPLNEGQGTSVADVTGNTQPGTLKNGPQWTPRGNDQALSFDGKDDRVDFTAGPKLRDLVNDFTIAFWAFPAAAQEDPNDPQRQTRTQVSHFAITPVRGSSVYGSDDHVGVGISVDADGIEVHEFGASFAPVLAYASQVGLAEWTHVAVVYEDRQPSLYVDGQFVMSGTKSTKGYVHASPAGFGGAPGASAKSYFQGLLQDVRIYDHALPAQAVEKLKGLSILPAQLRPPFVLTDRLSDQDLRNRRDLAERMLQVAGLNSPTYLKEVFYFAPLQIALQLQKSGEFAAALAWFRSVYAYNIPPDANLPPQPKIYYLLQLEKSVSNPLEIDSHWARDLDPHRLVAPRSDNAQSRSYPYTRYTLLCLARCLADYADSEFARGSGESIARARVLYATARGLLRLPELPAPGVSEGGGVIPPNTVLDTLRLRVGTQLAKLRQGRSIAGTSRATPYRFKVLLERSKQLVAIAQQIEAAYLSALEKRDAETYNLLKARNDLQLAAAGEKLQARRVIEAADGQDVIRAQKARNLALESKYSDMINEGPNVFELIMIGAIGAVTLASILFPPAGAAAAAAAATAGAAAAAGASGASAAAAIGAAAGVAAAAKTASASLGTILQGLLSATPQVAGIFDSLDRQKQQWDLQLTTLQQDDEVLKVQGQLADDHLAVVLQEQTIAIMQSAHAKAVADFLATKFTNAELYEWMSGVLGNVYGYFLQQATTMAQLAESQLAFERAEQPPTFIQPDYWELPSQTEAPAGSKGSAPDRRGLTGSARLLQDITQLDQFAFESDKRRLNLSQTFSLAQLFPYEFQKFRETGLLPFRTRMELFDRAFPGHYLRLIKRVRTSIVALIPPVQGIRATLSAFGTSRIVDGNLQPISVWREPETVALTSPTNASGVFELDMQSEMLQPFEDHGVDTQWEFRLPKPANPFDFATIADVLITIDYTALDSADYRQTVIRKLSPNISMDRAFSFRNDFPDQWYDLNNVPDSPAPLSVTFKIRSEDFPPNVKNDTVKTAELLAYFAPANGGDMADVKIADLRLHRGSDGSDIGASCHVASDHGVISTRRSSGDHPHPWRPITGASPIGDWTLAIADSDTRKLFRDGMVDDILFVITYTAEQLPWV